MKSRMAETMAILIVLVSAIAAISGQTAFAEKAFAYPYPVAYIPSIGFYDGWVLEKSEFSATGGSKNSTSSALIVGDDLYDRQYRSFLHFNTGDVLPDNATILRATLRLRVAGLTGTNPFRTHGALLVDVRKPYFGGTKDLGVFDFQAVASSTNVGQFGSTPINGWVSAVITKLSGINKTGSTQFRVYFKRDDNDDRGNDLLRFSSGSAFDKTYHPTLEIVYEIR